MKVSVNKEVFVKALNNVTRSLSQKPTLAVLANVVIATDAGRVRLSTTNLETGIHYWLGAKIAAEGATTVPGRVLNDFVTSLTTELAIDLELKEEVLVVKAGESQAKLPTIAVSEFPKIPILEGEPQLKITGSDFAKAVLQVAFAASFDEGRPILSGVLLKVGKKDTEIVATDGYRLSKKKLNLSSSEDLNVIVPARNLQEVARITQDLPDADSLGISLINQNQILFSLPNAQVNARVLEGSYPDYEKIIPKEFVTKMTVAKTQFNQALKTASIFARDLGNVVKISLEPEDGKITFSATTSQVGEGLSTIKAEGSGQTISTAFNAKYLIEAIAAVAEAEITFESAGPTNPALIRGKEDSSFFCLIMPVRVQS